MKAKFFLLGLCALGLMACSIDEVSQVNDTNAIQFKATTATRATATTTNNIQEFTVWAWNDSNLFMDGVTASKSGSVFTTSPLYFWPTGSVDFYALTEVVEHGIFTGTDSQQHEYALLGGEITESGDGWTYTGNVAKAQVDNGTIVIDACIPSTPEEQIDICYGVALEKSSGSVPMNFRHALSQVAFKAKNVNTAFDVKIADVSVCSVYSEGTYTIGKNDTSDNLATSDLGTATIASSQGSWAVTTEDENGVPIKSRYLVNMEDSIVQLDTEGTAVELVDPEGVLMLLPQEVVGWDPLTDAHDGNLGAYIRILCHVEESGSQLWPNNVEETYDGEDANFKEIGGEEYAEIAIPLEDVEWEQGYRYTYTIIFGEGLGYYPPDDPNYDLDGTPVLVPITFNVTVDEFQDAEGVDVPTDTDLSYIKVSTVAQLEGAVRSGYQEIDVALPDGETSATLELDGYLEFHSDCTLNIASGVTITGPNGSTEGNAIDHNGDEGAGGYSAIIYVNGCNLTITGDGTVTTDGSSDACLTNAIWVVDGTVTVYGGNFVGSNWNYDPTSTSWSKHAVYCGEGGYAYLYGGTYSCGYTNVTYATAENGYWVLNCHNASEEAGHAMIYCYGGTYVNFDPANPSTDDAKSYCANGYGTVSSTDSDGNTWFTVVETKVASLSDFKDALTAEASPIYISGTIDWGEPRYTDTDLMITYDCTIVLEEGSVINAPAVGEDSNSAVFVIENGANVVIEGTGTVATDGTSNSCGCGCVWVRSGSKVTINSGTFKGGAWNEDSFVGGAQNTIYVQEGSATIYGGTFYAGPDNSFGGDKTSTDKTIINLHDSNRSNGMAAAYVYGGYFCDWDPADNNSEGANTNFVVDGYVSTLDTTSDPGNNWFVVTEDK